MSLPQSLRYRKITYHSFEFEQAKVEAFGSRGTKYFRRINIGMPRIPDAVLDCVFYLYKSFEDAEKGAKPGGTGFLVVVPSELYPHAEPYLYAVTNKHVVLKGYTAIRVNTLDGGNEVFDTDPCAWYSESNSDDIAIYSDLAFLNPDFHRVAAIPVSLFATDEKIVAKSIGVGEDVFMVGRFVDHQGEATNIPSARFGNISVMLTPIKDGEYYGESYIIDMHSRTGYSGSPVFVYRTGGTNFNEVSTTHVVTISAKDTFLHLLGMHYGQFPEKWTFTLKEKPGMEGHEGLMVKEGSVDGLSGMTIVIPAQRILDLLNSERIEKARGVSDQELTEKFEREGYPPIPESN